MEVWIAGQIDQPLTEDSHVAWCGVPLGMTGRTNRRCTKGLQLIGPGAMGWWGNRGWGQCHHMSLMDFMVSLPVCGWSVTDFWGWDAHEAQLHCPDEVDGDIWIWSTRRGLNLSSTELPRPWSPWESSPSRKNPYGRTGNWTWDLMISSQKLWPLDRKMCKIGIFVIWQWKIMVCEMCGEE
jgi:hypothetical protein